MTRDIIIHNIPAYRRAMEELRCGRTFGVIGANDFHELPIEIKPIDNYVEIEGFPNCCENHKKQLKYLKEWFDEFPECCEIHKELLDQAWFDKSLYKGIELKILNRVSYTLHFIDDRIFNDNWYKDITDYIEFISLSFGHPNIGQAKFLEFLTIHIENAKQEDIPKRKQKRLLSFLNKENEHDYSTEPNINILHDIYIQWINSLPDLEFLNPSKSILKKQLPLFNSKEYNPYLKVFKYKIKLKSELIDFLLDSTKMILNNITGDKLLKKGIIKDIDHHQYQLLIEEHSTSQELDLGKFDNGEEQYLNILKRWLKKEKDFFLEIKPFISVRTKDIQTEPLLKEIFKNSDHYQKFITLLKSSKVEALNSDNEWIYEGPKSSIVSCFMALEDLEITKKIHSKAKLRRIVKQQIKFEGNEKLFRNSYDQTDFNYFVELFTKEIKTS